MNSSDLATLAASSLNDLAIYYTTHAVPQSYNPGLVIASVLVSYFGAWSTILLLARRTSNKGIRNIVLLVLAAIVMSTLGVWGMHFVGMHMSLRPAGEIKWYVGFDPGYTALSLLVTIFGSIVAFLFIDTVRFTLWRVVASGVLLGGVIGLMHFSASFNATFRATYRPLETVISILLAMAAATAALTIFFHPQTQGGKRWYRRAISSAVLAISVAGMHYIGMSGTSFTVRMSDVEQGRILFHSSQSDLVVTITTPVIAIIVLILCIAIHIVDHKEEKAQGQAARNVVICSAAFNKQGHLLVKEQGGLPMVVIKTPLRQSEVRAALDNRQPTFQWLYAVSWEWGLVADWLRAIGIKFLHIENGIKKEAKSVVSGGGGDQMPSPNLFERFGQRTRSGHTLDFDDPVMSDFRDRVIDAARQLAVELEIAFQEVGILYDSPIFTGTRKVSVKRSGATKETPSTVQRDWSDDEEGMSRVTTMQSTGTTVPSEHCGQGNFFSSLIKRRNRGEGGEEKREEGVVLFLVRKLEGTSEKPGGLTATEEHYLHRGFRMMDIRFLGAAFADRYDVSKQEANAMLKGLQTYAKRGIIPLVQPGGVYAGLFGVRASTSRLGGLETLVYSFARHQIPAFRLPKVERLTPELRRFIKRLDQISLDEAMETCSRETLRIKERVHTISLERGEGNNNDVEEDIVAEARALGEKEQFVASLYSALEALINSVRVYPDLSATARVSAEALQLPSSLDDSTEPAEIIIVNAVLPEETSAQVDASLTLPTDKPQDGTPFVFTPYSLFQKSQMMLIQGKEARDFEHEVRWEMKRRYYTWGTGGPPGDDNGGDRPVGDANGASASQLNGPSGSVDNKLSKIISGRRSSGTSSTVAELPPPTLSERIWSIVTFGLGGSALRRSQRMPLLKSTQRKFDLPEVATLAMMSHEGEGSHSADPLTTPNSPSSSASPFGQSPQQQLQLDLLSPNGLKGKGLRSPRSLTTIPESPRWPYAMNTFGGGGSTGTILLPAMMASPRRRGSHTSSASGYASPMSPKRASITNATTAPPLPPPTSRGCSWSDDKKQRDDDIDEEVEGIEMTKVQSNSSTTTAAATERTGGGGGGERENRASSPLSPSYPSPSISPSNTAFTITTTTPSTSHSPLTTTTTGTGGFPFGSASPSATHPHPHPHTANSGNSNGNSNNSNSLSLSPAVIPPSGTLLQHHSHHSHHPHHHQQQYHHHHSQPQPQPQLGIAATSTSMTTSTSTNSNINNNEISTVGPFQTVQGTTQTNNNQNNNNSQNNQNNSQSMIQRNPASLEARARSDGWTSRHLREIERGPQGGALLGVDY